MNWARISCSSSKMMMFVVAIILLVVQDVGAITVEQRQLQALKYHIDRPFPDLTSDWGIFNLAFSQLALNGTKNKTVAAQVSAEIETYPSRFMPWRNNSVQKGCPLSGLGELPILVRMALLPQIRSILSENAIRALNTLFTAWLSPRSNSSYAAGDKSWIVLDGSENLDATRKGSLYLTALALNKSSPGQIVSFDGKTVAEHAAAWERHWMSYFQHRAIEGLGVEMGSPTYAKYALQNYINIADLSPNLRELASNYLQLWFADYAHAFLKETGVRGGVHTRVYRVASFFLP
eukprot:m.5622 g.5622  ORF g.5622 m.5622 type:complete len:291 (-) comp3341_c0_seq2:1955-2827(-)